DLRRAGFLDLRDVGVGPDDFGAIVVVEVLDALTGITSDLAELDGVGKDARQDLHAIIGGARGIDPLVAPAANGRPNLLRAVELGNAQIAEIVRDTVEPFAPLRARRFRELFVLLAGFVGGNHAAESVGVGRSALLDGLVVAGDEFGRAR